MQAIIETDRVDVVGIADTSPEMAEAALSMAGGAVAADGLDGLLDMGLDGVVIATPSALHADQSIRALRRGVAVFCQKPLGRTAAEVEAVLQAARDADRLLGVDLSYRATEGMVRIRDLIRNGALGPIHAVDLVFHNAYGPDKPWFHDAALSGGGCLMDLGVHLIDLGLWVLDFPPVVDVAGHLFVKGERLPAASAMVEDYAVATVTLATGCVLRVACSWHLHAGQDAVISAAFYGRDGGAALRNVDGSFYDFVAERYSGTSRQTLATPPDAWGGRKAAEWAIRIADCNCFDPMTLRFVDVAKVLDRIYGR